MDVVESWRTSWVRRNADFADGPVIPVYKYLSKYKLALRLENDPFRSNRSNSRSTCRRTSPFHSLPLPRTNVRWNTVWFPVLAIRFDLDASPVAVNGCWQVESDSCS